MQMDEPSSTCEHPGLAEEEDANSLLHETLNDETSISSDKITDLKVLKHPEHETLDFHVSESESKSFSLSSVNVADEGQNGKIVFEVNNVKSPGLNNCNKRNKENPIENEVDVSVVASGIATDNQAFSSSNSTADIVFMNDSDIADVSRSPLHEFQCDKKSAQPTLNSEKPIIEQIMQIHTTISVPNDEQNDANSNLCTDQGLQDKDAHCIAITNINKNEKVSDNFESRPPCLSRQIRILNKEKNMCAFTDTSASVHTSAKTHSLLEPGGEVQDSSTDLSGQKQMITINSFTHNKTDSRSLKCSVYSCSEEVPNSQAGTDFQPIILDVCGGYCDMETDDGNENHNLENSGTSTKSSTKFAVHKNMHGAGDTEKSVPNSAFHLLQGMVQHVVSANQVHKKTSLAKNVQTTKTNTITGDNIADPSLVENVNEKNKSSNPERSGNSLPESFNCNSHSSFNAQTTVSSKSSNQHVSVLHMPLTVSLSASSKAPAVSVATCPVTSESQPNKSSQLFQNVILSNNTGSTAYSCVFVQDSKAKQNKVALLIPQTSLTGIQTSVTSTHNSKTHATPSCPESVSRILIPESISKMVTDTMNRFCLKGKDLKGSTLLKVGIPKKNRCSKDSVQCFSCGEDYYTEQGLYFHLKRTVFHLSFYCLYCKQTIVFYNKCSLWMHLKSETEKPVLNYNDILCLRPYEFDTDGDTNTEMLETVDGTSASETGASVYAADASIDSDLPACTGPNVPPCTSPNLPVCKSPNLPVCKSPNLHTNTTQVEEVTADKSVGDCTVSVVDNCAVSVPEFSSNKAQQMNMFKCQICLQEFPNLTAHLCPTVSKRCMCPSCGMFLPSNCAQVAHMKIHRGVVKNISCPECGENDFKMMHGNEDMRSVFDHVDSCKHFNRILSITCFCNQEFINVNQLMEHFTVKHIRTLFKCPYCVLAFTQHEHFVGHLDKIHKIKGKQTGISVLCLFCQQIIKSAVELRDHIDQHVEHFKNNSVFKWKCFICTKSYVDKAELNNHVEQDLPHKSKRCTICYSLFWSRKNLVDHIVQKKCLRQLAQKLNYCVDMQPEVSETVTETVDLNKLFEIKQTSPSVGAGLERPRIGSLVNKSQRLISIAPKPSLSQLLTHNSSLPKKQQNGLENSSLKSVTKQKQVVPAVSSAGNSFTGEVSPQTCKISVSSKSNTTSPRRIMRISGPVSQCTVCKIFIESTQLSNHLKLHQSRGVVICYCCQRRDFTTLKEVLSHSEICGHKTINGVESQKTQTAESSRAKEVSDEASNMIEQLAVEHHEHQQGEIGEKVENNQQSVFPCLLCGLAFQSLSTREEHVSRSHDGTRTVYHCGLCRKRGKAAVFTKRELASRHITKKHRIVNMDTVNRLIKTEEQNVSSGQKLPASESVSSEADGEPAPKRLRVAGAGDYMCGKCGFSCSKSEEFSQHIASHNSTQEPQCPECGLCFTILPALKKHLIAVHKIKAVDDYMKLKNIVEPEVEEEEIETVSEIQPFSKPQLRSQDSNSDKSIASASAKVTPYNPLECTVCYKVFDNEINLKTHMRNHGMAFIRSKRHKLL